MIYGSFSVPLPVQGLTTVRLLKLLLMEVLVLYKLPAKSFTVPLMLFTVKDLPSLAEITPLNVSTLLPEPE